jgi:hypothetical protein
MAKINGRKKNVRRDVDELVGHYVIVYYKDGKVNYLADKNMTDWNWTNRIYKAKCYYDLSAADIKAINLRYDPHPIHAKVKYVTRNLQLVEPRRDTYGRR